MSAVSAVVGWALPLLLAVPLLASLVLNLWDGFWQQPSVSPLSERAQTALHVAQGATVVALVGPDWASRLGLLAAALLYGAMAVGSAYLLHTRGAVPCGCWGAREDSRLGYPMILTNLGIAALAAVAFMAGAGTSADLATGVVQLLSLLSLTALVVVGGREIRAWWGPLSERVSFEMRWYRGFPDVRS